MRKRLIFWIVLTLCLCINTTAWAGISELVDALIAAQIGKQSTPVLSKMDLNLDNKTAYEVQKTYVKKRLANDTVAGFKGALTSLGAQKKFGLNSPVTGVLFTSGKLEGSPIIERTAFRGLMIETEIGFIIGKPITKPIKSMDELKKKISAILPAIELPELGFADMQSLNGVDVIAANVGSVKFIQGLQQSYPADINQISVTLYHNGQVVNQGKGNEVMGDQWKTVLWLVNRAVEQGYKVEPGQIIMTGSLGPMIPGKPGSYVADYGDFGKISFIVK